MLSDAEVSLPVAENFLHIYLPLPTRFFLSSHWRLLGLSLETSSPRKRIYKIKLCVYKFKLCVYKTRQDLYTHNLCVEISVDDEDVLCWR